MPKVNNKSGKDDASHGQYLAQRARHLPARAVLSFFWGAKHHHEARHRHNVGSFGIDFTAQVDGSETEDEPRVSSPVRNRCQRKA